MESLINEIKKNVIFRMNEAKRFLETSINMLPEDKLWDRPNMSLSAPGNLLLHMNGNLTQYIISSLGSGEDKRERDTEFLPEQAFTKQELKDLLFDSIDLAEKVIMKASKEELERVRGVQGFQFSGVGCAIHAVEHLMYHTGQISFWVKYLKDADLGYYAGADLNAKNE